MEANVVFVSKNSRTIVTDFLNQMGGLCNAELSIAEKDGEIQPSSEYERMALLADSVVEVLYKELNLPKS